MVPKRIKGVTPHYIENQELIFSKGNSLFRTQSIDAKDSTLLGIYQAGFIKNILCKFSLSKRIIRLGFQDVRLFKEGYIGIQNRAIVYLKKGEKNFETVFTGFRGSRPLRLEVYGGKVYFGEYFGNPERESVCVYSSSDLVQWEKAWEFSPGEIRHVHGIEYDKHRDGLWVLTGDSDEESGLWFTRDDFASLEKVIGDDQRARAVEILPLKDQILVPMDSPKEQNFIHSIEPISKKYDQVAKIKGSAFHISECEGVFFCSTVTEPSEVNKTESVGLYASLDGKNWKEISSLQKDVFPVKYQFITRYSELRMVRNYALDGHLVVFGQALKTISSGMLVWKIADIKAILQ